MGARGTVNTTNNTLPAVEKIKYVKDKDRFGQILYKSNIGLDIVRNEFNVTASGNTQMDYIINQFEQNYNEKHLAFRFDTLKEAKEAIQKYYDKENK